MRRDLGIDFGTTNSAVAVAEEGHVRIARFRAQSGLVDTFRSVLYFEAKPAGSSRRLRPIAGPMAITRYLEDEVRGRLIQSIKSFLASRVFTETSLGHRRYTLEDLVAAFTEELRAECAFELGDLGPRVVVGRPVRYSGAATEADQAFAMGRVLTAFQNAGFREVHFELEPVAAAYHYESRLSADETILIADFGGGTSDFSVLRVGPGVRRGGRTGRTLLATSGVALAGDAFDAKIIRNMVSPDLGMGTSYQSLGKVLPVPRSLYLKLEKWHHLSFLKSKDTMDMLRALRAGAFEPDKLQLLIDLVEFDLGFHLHRAVQRAKFDLSHAESTTFDFHHEGIRITRQINRADFEHWIRKELEAIESCVDEALARSGLTAGAIDRVFLTGGTSLVPAVRRIFETRFGEERLRAGDEFTSVASGLALRAADLP